jgi:[ribosomal protein S5]-alanine N-acetyltransferase
LVSAERAESAGRRRSVTRLLAREDAAELAAVLAANRTFMAPWEPVRDDRYFTADGQRDVIAAALEQHAQGAGIPHVIVDGPGESDGSGAIVGRITLNGIVRGPFLSCSVGYWVSEAANGRGLATAALREMVRVAFDDLGLHRVQAETLIHNHASQRVLERNGFVRFGLAPAYLNIAGQWQDHIMFQLVRPPA